jgi:hypothetical protein
MVIDDNKHKIKDIIKNLSKSRLAQKIIENYIYKSKMSFSVLQKVWYDDLQGGKGVIKKLADIDVRNEQNYYTDAPITLGDGTRIAICNQWRKENFSNFILHAKQLGIDIKAESIQLEPRTMRNNSSLRI